MTDSTERARDWIAHDPDPENRHWIRIVDHHLVIACGVHQPKAIFNFFRRRRSAFEPSDE